MEGLNFSLDTVCRRPIYLLAHGWLAYALRLCLPHLAAFFTKVRMTSMHMRSITISISCWLQESHSYYLHSWEDYTEAWIQGGNQKPFHYFLTDQPRINLIKNIRSFKATVVTSHSLKIIQNTHNDLLTVHFCCSTTCPNVPWGAYVVLELNPSDFLSLKFLKQENIGIIVKQKSLKNV